MSAATLATTEWTSSSRASSSTRSVLRRDRSVRGVLIQVPAEVKHRVRNSGDRLARVVFFFDSPRDVVTFGEPLMPMDVTVVGGEG
jgi:hypothetical protein